jgi:ABC-type Fe3+ transport system permease subunit
MALAAVPGMAVVRAVGGLPGRLAADPLDGPISGERWLPLLKNTALVGGIATAVATGLGALVGLLIARTDLPGRRLLGAAAILGACIPAYASAVIVLDRKSTRLNSSH